MTQRRDPGLDALLQLDGEVLVVDPEGRHWVRFAVTRVPASPAKPYGLDYSLTLHGPDGERWSDSPPRIPRPDRSAASHRIIVIGSGR